MHIGYDSTYWLYINFDQFRYELYPEKWLVL